MNWLKDILVALIYTAPPSFLAWLAWRQGKSSHKLVNSRMDELVALTRKSARAKGRLEGQAAEKKKILSRR